MKVSGNVRSRDGTSIAFERAGGGPALILVDAAGGYRGFGPMAPLAAQLDSRFTVFTYDRRGRGASTNTLPYAVEREIDDLLAAARGLAIPKLALVEPLMTGGSWPGAESWVSAPASP
jgi:pimeloyl-ACP methyl ester carboxylesterase